MSSLKPCMSKIEKFIGPLFADGVPKPSKGDSATGLKVAKPEGEKVKIKRKTTEQQHQREKIREINSPIPSKMLDAA